ncbi:hypothetical protein ACFQZZ_16220 [Nocardia sp. GCM10030253]|uniref:hypothetical protein n=1 Tax=Nocardia sp. GCM10030253 TaxID=3273404 RepID=UPI0036261B45
MLLVVPWLLAHVVGGYLVWQNWKNASPDDIVKIELNKKQELPQGFGNDLAADWRVIVGYACFLLANTIAARGLAWSRGGRIIASAGIAASLVAVSSDIVENIFLSYSGAGGTDWRVQAAVAATIKFSALIPAIAVSLWGFGLVPVRIWQWSIRARNKSSVGISPEESSPEPESDGQAEPDVASGDQARWRKAYDVPNVNPRAIREVYDDNKHTTAVCLSGGGIRSACVALGAMQIFAKTPRSKVNSSTVLGDAKYVISVSGGGYTSGAFVQAVQPYFDNPRRRWLNPAARPTRATVSTGNLPEAFTEGSVELDYLRRHSSYIADSPASMLKALAVVAQNLILSLILLFSPAVVAGVIMGAYYTFVPVSIFPPVQHDGGKWVAQPYSGWWAVAICAGAALAAGVFMVVRQTFILREQPTRFDERLRVLVSGLVWFAVVVAAIVVGVPGLMRCGDWLVNKSDSVFGDDKSGAMSVLGTTVSAIVVLNYIAALAAIGWRNRGGLARIATFGKAATKAPKAVPRGAFQLLLVLITLVILVAAWLVTFGGVAANTFETFAGSDDRDRFQDPLIALGVATIALVLLSGLDISSLSLHPFYRRRLARAFAVRRVKSEGTFRADAYPPGEGTALWKYGQIPDQNGQPAEGCRQIRTPKFVFAAAATVSGTDRPAPGLTTVSYTMSADYIGGPDVGWVKTKELHDAVFPRLRRDLTVQGAVAISGAAFASAMGRANSGYQTLLAASGARLGAWLPNPNFVVDEASPSQRKKWSMPHGAPRFRGGTYLFRELFGINPKTARLLLVTDGGHYENLGLIEALRRRCTQIYCIDASGDAPPAASTLAEAMRLAEFELGVKIKLQPTEGLAPGSGQKFAPESAFGKLNARLTRDAVIRGDIYYPRASGLGTVEGEEDIVGELIVAKAVLWDQCDNWLRSYAIEDEAFPHDSTGDQWFTEGQFAAYSQLGRMIATAAIQSTRQGTTTAGASHPPDTFPARTPPPNIPNTPPGQGLRPHRAATVVRRRGIRVPIARTDIEPNERRGRPRWIIQRIISWLTGYHRLTMRYEHRDNH